LFSQDYVPQEQPKAQQYQMMPPSYGNFQDSFRQDLSKDKGNVENDFESRPFLTNGPLMSSQDIQGAKLNRTGQRML
jgi:hypothetical protein